MLTFSVRPYDDPDVVRMVAAVQAEYVLMYGGPDESVVDASELAPPAGVLHVGYLDDGKAVAMGGWRWLHGCVAELKRMYIEPELRGRGLSRQVLAYVEQSAIQAGVEEFVLNTGPHQVAAIALYERSGYQPVTPFGHYACTGDAVFYGRRLVTGSSDGRISPG